jgi:hypothetical protein
VLLVEKRLILFRTGEYAMEMRFEKIKSDKTGHGPYVVGIDKMGKAVSCTCVHGRFGKSGVCYHKRRGEKAQAFRVARTKYIEAGYFCDVVDFNAYFLGIASQLESVDAAIDQVLAEVPTPESTCPRCHGKGTIPKFMHVKEGVCFRCKGSGREAIKS